MLCYTRRLNKNAGMGGVPTWFLIIALSMAIIAIIAYFGYRYAPPLTHADFDTGSLPFGQKQRDKKLRYTLLGPHEPEPPSASQLRSEPLWLEPAAKQARRNHRAQQAWQYRHAIIAAELVSLLLTLVIVHTWFLPITQANVFLVPWFTGIGLTLYGAVIYTWNYLRLNSKTSQLRIGLDQENLLLATPTGAIQHHPINTLAFDGRWLRAGSHYFDMIRPASKQERLQYGCSHVPRYDRGQFLQHVLPWLNGNTLVSPHLLHRDHQRAITGAWPRACMHIGPLVTAVSSAMFFQ